MRQDPFKRWTLPTFLSLCLFCLCLSLFLSFPTRLCEHLSSLFPISSFLLFSSTLSSLSPAPTHLFFSLSTWLLSAPFLSFLFPFPCKTLHLTTVCTACLSLIFHGDPWLEPTKPTICCFLGGGVNNIWCHENWQTLLMLAHQESEMCLDPRLFNSVTFPTKGLLGPFVKHQLESVSPSFSTSDFFVWTVVVPISAPLTSLSSGQLHVSQAQSPWSIFLHANIGESLCLLESLYLGLTTNWSACCATSLVLAEFLECYGLGLGSYFSTSVMENVPKLFHLFPQYPSDLNPHSHLPALHIRIFYGIFVTSASDPRDEKRVPIPYSQVFSFLHSKLSLFLLRVRCFCVSCPTISCFFFSKALIFPFFFSPLCSPPPAATDTVTVRGIPFPIYHLPLYLC